MFNLHCRRGPAGVAAAELPRGLKALRLALPVRSRTIKLCLLPLGAALGGFCGLLVFVTRPLRRNGVLLRRPD